MKTRAFKKVLSVICVLAMLMSVCVVSLVGVTSAAEETYKLSVNGIVTQVSLAEGATLPTPDAGIPGVEFLGWYDKTLTTEYTQAGDVKELYAKFSSNIYTFESSDYAFDPNNVGATWEYVTDPTDSTNHAVKWKCSSGRTNFGIPVLAGINDEGFKLEAGATYEFSAKVYYTGTSSSVAVTIHSSHKSNVGRSNVGDPVPPKKTLCVISGAVESGEWTTISGTYTVKDTDVVSNGQDTSYLLISYYADPGKIFDMIVDDFMVTKINGEQEYTFNNKGTVTTETLTPGSALPNVASSTFMGWYDESLSVKYSKVPASNTKLVARYSDMHFSYDEEVFAFDPNNKLATSNFSVAADPTDANNNALKINMIGVESRFNYAPVGSIGAKAGYTITKGQVYTVTFRYYLDCAEGKSADLRFYTAADAGIGVDGNKAELRDWDVKLDKIKTWTEVTKDFVLDPTSNIDLTAMPSLLLTAKTDIDNDAVLYIDDLSVAHYIAPVSTDDFVMDFEDDFEWVDGTVANINNYTVSSGNGYVNRGQLVEENGNTFFRVKHFKARNANLYFTVNDGTKQFEMFNTGLYTIEFDYKVEHSETPTTLGLAFVQPTNASTGFKFSKLTELDSFTTRDDEGWTHVSYSFVADLYGIEARTSLAIYLNNTTNVPEEDDLGNKTATSVAFDNIVVHTHSGYADNGMIKFDSKGGSAADTIVKPIGKVVDILPVPTRYCYVFTGWAYKSVDAEGNEIEVALKSTDVMQGCIINAYATWKLVDGAVELNFKSNVPAYDSTTPSIVAFAGQPITNFPTTNPTASGQKFLGWYYDTGFTKPVDVNCAPEESATCYARWESQGTVIDFENYPENFFNAQGFGNTSQVSDAMSIKELDNGNHALYYSFADTADQSNPTHGRTAILHTGTDFVTAFPGQEYTVTFKYKVAEVKAKGEFLVVLSSNTNLWANRLAQKSIAVTDASDEWKQASITFTANPAANTKSNNNYISFGCSNDAKIYIDDIVVTSDFNAMNIYGTAAIYNTNGGKDINPTSGEIGEKINPPTPVRPGYKFLGWFTDSLLTTPLEADAVYGEETINLYAKWQLGKFTEGFEDYPSSVKGQAISGAYSFYNNKSAGFDASNIRSGETSLFRNGTTAGVKNFTLMRESGLALTVGETYTLSFYVKPTSVTNAAGTISMIDMKSYTGINAATASTVISKVSDLKIGEWNLVSYTFTAKSEYIGIQTTDGNDMYFDDMSVTLKGYTGSATTGDSSVNPIVVIALVVVCAGALLITGKKIFSK